MRSIHALRGRSSTHSEGGLPRAQYSVFSAPSTSSEGGDPRAPREAFHTLRGRRKVRSTPSRGVIHALQRGVIHALPREVIRTLPREVIHALRGS